MVRFILKTSYREHSHPLFTRLHLITLQDVYEIDVENLYNYIYDVYVILKKLGVVQRSVAAPTTAVLLLHVFDVFQLADRFNISQVRL